MTTASIHCAAFVLAALTTTSAFASFQVAAASQPLAQTRSLAVGSGQQHGQQHFVIPTAPPSVTPISALPFTINVPGYYRVTKDLTGVAGDHGIFVNADDVVIDLNGFTLEGVAGSLFGIFGGSRTVIFNGQLGSWEIGAIMGPRCVLYGVEFLGNQDGALIDDASLVENCLFVGNTLTGLAGGFSSRIMGCEFAGNGIGLDIEADNIVEDCTMLSNTQDGLHASGTVTVIRCIARSNGGDGFELIEGGSIEDCSAIDNAGVGVAGGPATRVTGCRALENTTGGICVLSDSRVADCEVTDNVGFGMRGSQNVAFHRCTSSRNAAGIEIEITGGNIADCIVTDNLHDGVSVVRRTVVAHNAISSNGGHGIDASASGNRIDGNNLVQNGVGISITGTQNLIVRNSLESNGVQMQIANDNVQGPLLKTKGFIDNTNPWANFDLSFPSTFP